jgi:hemerythrin-like domain-containing protein
MDMEANPKRREFLAAAIAAGAGTLVAGYASGAQPPSPPPAAKPPEPAAKPEDKSKDKPGEKPDAKDEKDDDVSPAEDLMREHGVLKRVLLVYGEVIRRLEIGEDLAPEPLLDAAGIIRNFIEDYHEKLEEDFLFPRFRKAKMHVDLVDMLTAQHQAGRRVTEMTMRLATVPSMRDPHDRPRLIGYLKSFIRMYEPHEAREDTVLFPALRKIVSANEYAALGEDFEKKEHALFGDDGFEKMVDKVATIEKKLDIYELGKFTPFV